MADLAKLAIEVDASQATAAAKQLDTLSKSATGAQKSTDTVGKASATAGKEAGNSAYKYRMAAMQLSQVASQGAVTGNYLQALAIQIPDLVLGFGTLAIVAGSVAGALAGPLINALTASNKGINDLTDDLDALAGSFDIAADGSYKLSEELVRLARISEEAAKLKVAVETESARKNLLELGLAMREAFSELTGNHGLSALDKLDGITLSDKLAKELKITKEEAQALQSAMAAAVQSKNVDDYSNFANVIGDLSSKYGRNNRELLALTAGMAEFIEAGATAADNYGKLTKAGTDWSEMLRRSRDEVKTLYADTMTLFDTDAYSLDDWLREQFDIDAARVQSRADSLKAIEALETSLMTQQERLTGTYREQQYSIADALAQGVIAVEEANAMKLASDQQYYIASYQLALQDAQQREALNASMVSSAQSLNDNLVAALEAYGQESSDLGLAAIAVQKGLMVAQAIMGANMAAIQTQVAYAGLAAATLNPALIEVGAARAEIVRGMGYASAAMIAATEFAPARALGGQVEAGTTYLVGERGPELVTMGANGYVTPNNQMQGSNQTVVLQISTGVSQTVRAEMAAMMPGIVKMIGRATRG